MLWGEIEIPESALRKFYCCNVRKVCSQSLFEKRREDYTAQVQLEKDEDAKLLTSISFHCTVGGFIRGSGCPTAQLEAARRTIPHRWESLLRRQRRSHFLPLCHSERRYFAGYRRAGKRDNDLGQCGEAGFPIKGRQNSPEQPCPL